ncbi:MAG: PAS domain S-box protein [Pseudorhodoplanes sp.]
MHGAQHGARATGLERYGILGERDRRHIDHLVRLISGALRVPIVTITLLPETRLQMIAVVGFPPVLMTAKELSITQACVQHQGPMVMPDLLADPRYREHPRVVATPFARSAVAVPFRSDQVAWLGAVIVWDVVPREFSDAEVNLLQQFAIAVADEVNLTRALAETHAREQLLATIFDNAAVGILVNSLDGRRIACNTRFCEFLDYTREEIISRPVGSLMHPDDVAEGANYHRLMASGQIDTYQREARFIARSGEPVWLKISTSILAGVDDRARCVIVIAENINDRLRAEHSSHVLLGEINHRVNNTLAIVQGMTRQLLRVTRTREEFASALEHRIQSLRISHDLLNDCSWRPLGVDRIVEGLLESAWSQQAARVTYSGSQVVLNAQSTVFLGMVLNELLDRSVRGGALAHRNGRVRIVGEERKTSRQRILELIWREEADQPFAGPGERYISTILETPLLAAAGGRYNRAETANSIVWAISLPIYGQCDDFVPGRQAKAV